jgi:hypothetical protein
MAAPGVTSPIDHASDSQENLPQILLLACGNMLRGDDGIGVAYR